MSSSKVTSLVCAVSVSGLVLASMSVRAGSAIWPRNKVCKGGYATETGSGYSGGALLLDPIPPNMDIAAMSPHQLNLGGVPTSMAGAWLEVTGPTGKAKVYVTDLYPKTRDCALDMSLGAFKKISGKSSGIVNISWILVEGPSKVPVQYRIKEGSSVDWAAVQVRRTRYPVTSMDYYKSGRWISAERTGYNHFILLKPVPKDVRVRYTDVYDHRIYDYIPWTPPKISSRTVRIVTGYVQFPY
ncbi:Expansin-YoaJ [Dickeya dianthicola]|nr:expansin EXLX1 family cellulose-binding protein [Dickeya dianthicola]MCI4114175.1 Expansin-YoaJ [Dickeya dianthicola]MCI4117953.1 Expansin-YoaJ [Dickeya dianthicola]MCI4122367.1 Expansin-YoaJ [Dickeya dianthicola]UOO20801.1 Expansin-YoaJ [Dickeya dianthicola]